MKKRMFFSVVTARSSASEQMQLLEGIITRGFEMNIDIAVISNIYNASEYNISIKNEDSIYDIIRSQRPDGIIITADAFMNSELKEHVYKLAGDICIPVLCIGADNNGFTSLSDDTSEDIRAVTDHLIEKHGFTHIDILTGPQDSSEAQRRVEGYKRSMTSHGLEVSECNIIYGDFWTNSGRETALEYVSSKRKMPQALVCCNDYMAFAVIDTFTEHNIKISEDITVTGYEYVEGRLEHYPLLSTFSRNRKALGAEAVCRLYEIVSGEKSTMHTDISGFFIPGNTCSCGADCIQISAETEELKSQKFYVSLNDTGMFEQYLTETETISDLIAAMKNHSYILPGISGLFMCLYEDWCISRDTVNDQERDPGSMICYTITDNYREGNEPERFSIDQIIPDSIINENIPNAYFCCPLFFMNESFGYMAVRYDSFRRTGESFRNWNKIVSNALEFLRMKNDINYLMNRHNLSEYRDSFTGMRNFEGFINETAIKLRNSDKSGNIVICMIRLTFDEEIIPGTEFYESRNRIIKKIASHIKKMSSENKHICGRISENSFCIAVTDSTDEALLTEKISVLLYTCFSENSQYGDDMYITEIYSGKVCHTDCRSVINELKTKTEEKYRQIQKTMDDSEYILFRDFRRSVYLNPEKAVSADEACRKFLLSSGHFRVLYKKIFGISYHQDCIALRIMMAKSLLLTTHMNISAVSEKCRFDNEKYFMRQFRLNTGYTPNQYRELFE